MLPILDEENHKYTDEITGEQLLGVSEILQLARLTDFSDVPEDVLSEAQERGTNGHYACELYDKGILDYATLCEGLKPILERWKGFISDYGIVFAKEDIERIVWSDVWGFVGRFDRVGLIKKKRVLVDIKITSKIYRSTKFQTMAYKIAYEERTGLKVDERWIVNLKKEGKAIVTPYTKQDDVYDRKIFLSAINIANEKIQNGGQQYGK